MAITATTLSTAVLAGNPSTDYFINVASATGITAPNFTSGAGITWLLIDQEFMLVTSVSGTVIGVLRGQNGTQATPHVINSQVQIGLPGDYANFGEFLGASLTVKQTEGSLNWPATFLAGTADAIPAGVAGFYVVKTGSADLMTLAAPTAAQEGNIIQVWSDTAFAHTITATSLIAAGVALKTTITFPAFRGAGVILRACNLVYHLLSGGGSATNGGPVVLT
jgi:hypothetical protein